MRLRLLTLATAAMGLLASPAAWGQPLSERDVLDAIAFGTTAKPDDLLPMRLAFGDDASPVNIALVYPPQLRIALAAAHARHEKRPFGVADVTPEMSAPVLHALVPDRPGLGAFDWRTSRVRAERLTVLSGPGWRQATDALWVRDDPSMLIPGPPIAGQARVFGLAPDALAGDVRVVVTFVEPALNTGGDNGRDIRCTLRGQRNLAR